MLIGAAPGLDPGQRVIQLLGDTTNTTITVVRRAGLTGTATVQLATSDGTAVQGVDYVGLTNTLTFVNGQNTTNITVRILDNLVANPNKTVVLTLLNPSPGAGLGTVNPATITIVDNDVGLQFTTNNFSVLEAGPNATITVTRTGDTALALTVNYGITGSALHGTDYVALPGVLTIPAGSSSATVTISLRRRSPNSSLMCRSSSAMIFVMRSGLSRMSSRSAITAITSLYSSRILSCSRPVRRCRRSSRIACAWASDSR